MQQVLLASSLGPLVSTTGTASTRAPVYFGVVTSDSMACAMCVSPRKEAMRIPNDLFNMEIGVAGLPTSRVFGIPISKCNRFFEAAPTLAHSVHGGAWNTLLRKVMFTKHVGAAMMLLYTVRLRTIERKPSSWS